MPWPVYSERFAYTETLTPFTYTVPDGKRAIVTSLTVVNLGVSQAGASLRVHGLVVAFVSIQAAGLSQAWQLYCVAYERETITVTVGLAGMTVMACGFLFDDPVGKPAGAGPPGEMPGAVYPNQPQAEPLPWRAG